MQQPFVVLCIDNDTRVIDVLSGLIQSGYGHFKWAMQCGMTVLVASLGA